MRLNISIEPLTNGFIVYLTQQNEYTLSAALPGTFFNDMASLKRGLPDLVDKAAIQFGEREEQRRLQETGMQAQKQAYAERYAMNQAAQGKFYDERR